MQSVINGTFSSIWPVFALLSAILWTIVSLFDRYSVRAIFTSPSQGMLVSSLFSLAGLALFPFVDWGAISQMAIVVPFIAGIFVQFSQLAYFYAINREQVGDVTALGASYPLIVALLALFFGKYLSIVQWSGIFVVVFSLVVIKWKGLITKKSLGTLPLIFLYVLFLAVSSMLMNLSLDDFSFFSTFPFYCLGLVVGGLVPLLSPKQRQAAIRALPIIIRSIRSFGLIEVINVVALACEVFALGKAHPALVTAISSTEPAFAFLFANFLSSKKFFPEGCYEKVDGLWLKIFSVIMLSIGLTLLALE
jgi:drug/metabolite transporter (DMT)-like permease